VVLVYLDSDSENEEDTKGLLRAPMPGLMGARRVRSNVLKMDGSRPGPPLVRGKDSVIPSERSTTKYLCFG
jgi:hypothetical protein